MPFGVRPEGVSDTLETPFICALPCSEDQIAAIRTLRITHGDEVLAERHEPGPRACREPMARAKAPGVVQLDWDPAVHPAVMVWDPGTAEVIAMGTSGKLEILTSATELVLDLSDGVKSVRRKIAVQP
jgi:hypothetical protein